MKLLIEQAGEFTIKESEDDKSLYIEGIFIQCDIVNKNRRIYEKSKVDSSIRNYIKNEIDKKSPSSLGELNHPNHPDVNAERACIRTVSLTESGSNYIGKAKVLEKQPMGAIVGGLIREGIVFGVSSRALGTVKYRKDGIAEIQSDIRFMTCADVVTNPSAPQAFVDAVFEGKDWVFENGILKEDDTKQFVDSNYKQILENPTKFGELLNLILQDTK